VLDLALDDLETALDRGLAAVLADASVARSAPASGATAG
jgi:hypothetical protein